MAQRLHPLPKVTQGRLAQSAFSRMIAATLVVLSLGLIPILKELSWILILLAAICLLVVEGAHLWRSGGFRRRLSFGALPVMGLLGLATAVTLFPSIHKQLPQWAPLIPALLAMLIWVLLLSRDAFDRLSRRPRQWPVVVGGVGYALPILGACLLALFLVLSLQLRVFVIAFLFWTGAALILSGLLLVFVANRYASNGR